MLCTHVHRGIMCVLVLYIFIFCLRTYRPPCRVAFTFLFFLPVSHSLSILVPLLAVLCACTFICVVVDIHHAHIHTQRHLHTCARAQVIKMRKIRYINIKRKYWVPLFRVWVLVCSAPARMKRMGRERRCGRRLELLVIRVLCASNAHVHAA